MEWKGLRQSSNVDDRRGVSGGPLAVGGGIVGVIFLLAKFLLGGGDAAEIERYMAIPGQALSYKIGALKIRELREKYKNQLGNKFSLAAFEGSFLKPVLWVKYICVLYPL